MDGGSIEQVARLARIEIDDESKLLFQAQLGAILEHFRVLGEVDLDGVEPLFHVGDPAGRTRHDEPEDGPPRDELIENAPRTRDGAFEVPRVIE